MGVKGTSSDLLRTGTKRLHNLPSFGKFFEGFYMKSKSEKLSLKGLSKAFGVSQVSVRNWIDKGIPCKRTSRGYTFDLTEAIQWREKHLQESKQGGNNEYEAARTEKEIYRAKMAKLNYERMEGTLISAQDVRELMFNTARLTRDAILNIPGRLSALLANQPRDKIHEMLTKELRQALEALANKFCDLEKKD